MSQAPKSEVLQATRRAVARIRSFGIDGPRPIDEIEALNEHGGDVDAALQAVVRDAAPGDLAAAIHLVVLMRREAVLDTVREIAFATPSSLAAKREAVEALRRCDVEPDADVVDKLAVIDAIAAHPGSEAFATLMDWPPAWREPALDEWLGRAGEEQLSSVEIGLGIQPELDVRLLDWIGARGTIEAAQVLQRFLAKVDDKNRVKQVKKALHRLRSQGIEIDDAVAAADGSGFSMAIESGELHDARAYVTSIDGSGARLVWVLWRAPSGGSRLLQAVIDDTAGVREADVATVTRQGFREYVEQMQANPTVLLQQVSLESATATLAAAAAHTEARGGDLPPAYTRWADMVGVAPGASGPPPIYEQVAADEVRDNPSLIDESMKLLREEHFQSWAMEGTLINEAAEEIHEAETSTLVLSDEQRQERMQDAIRNAVSKSFDDATRRRYRARLEVMAQMLWDRNQQDAARQALAAAVALTEMDDLFRGHAFARALAHRGVWLAYQDKQRELVAERQRAAIMRP